MNVIVWLTFNFSWKTDIFRISHRIRTFYDHKLIRPFTDIRFAYMLYDSNKCLYLGLGTLERFVFPHSLYSSNSRKILILKG